MPSDIMQFFAYDHLRDEKMRETSKLFAELAQRVEACDDYELAVAAVHETRDAYAQEAPDNTEANWAVRKLTQAANTIDATENPNEGLRKILEAKDCAVRALIFKPGAGRGARS